MATQPDGFLDGGQQLASFSNPWGGAVIQKLASFVQVGNPVYQNISPTPSFSIAPNVPIQFDIVDALAALVLVVPIITVDGTVAGERVYDWSSTTPQPNGAAPGTATNQGPGVFDRAYAAKSTLVAITNGWRFTIFRKNGWATPPTLRCFAVDAFGTVGVL